MFHRAFMPSAGAACERRVAACFAVALVWLILASVPAQALRFASINACADQLLLALADPDEIAGLSPYANDPERSFYADRAGPYPRLSGAAEDVLTARPDVVLAGRFTKRETRGFLRDHGFRVIELERPTTIASVEQQLRETGALLGHSDRADAAVARIEAALARLRTAAAQRHRRVLAVARRGWVSGQGGLIDSLLEAGGLQNAAIDAGRRVSGYATLEAIIAAKPDLLLLQDRAATTPDQGAALLVHPALQQLFPPDKRIYVPERLTVCAGPMLADALDAMRAEILRVAP